MINQQARLEKAGCFVIYGVGKYKTHTKMLMIIRKEGDCYLGNCRWIRLG